MRTLKLVIVWLIYLAVCTGAVFAFTLAPLPTVALYFIGYLLVRYVITPRCFPAPPAEPGEDDPEE